MKKLFISILMFLILCTGCNKNDNGTPNQLYSVSSNVLSDVEENVSINLNVPQLYPENDVSSKINAYFIDIQKSDAENFKSQFSLADTSININSSFNVSLNNENIISIKRLLVTDTGGVHPNYAMISENFFLSDGHKLALSDLFSVSQDKYVERIVSLIQDNIVNVTDYFPDYAQLISSNFSDADFYLTDDALVIFYQVYSLGPYPLGIPEFEIKYDSISDILSSEVKHELGIN